MAKTTASSAIRISRHLIPAHGLLPNCSIQNRPLLIYHSVFEKGTSATAIEDHLKTVGVVQPQWRASMYATTHYHSTTHELLCISSGSARLCFGGEDNPERVETVVSKGDVIIIPAGVSHRLLEDLDGGFEMVGSYPPGKRWDMCYGMKKSEEIKHQSIEKLPWFEKDPIYGDEGHIMD